VTTNRLRDRWTAGISAIGGWCMTPSPFVAELFATDGFDYLGVDCQHGLVGYDAMVPMLQAVARTDATPVVRVPYNEAAWIGKALDAGAEAVIVPMVNSRADAERAVAACRYFPDGARSYGPIRSGLFLGGDPATANREVACLVMIETEQAVEAAEEICTTPGVDGIYLGPADLAITLGLPPSFELRPGAHEDAVLHVLKVCQANGIAAGIHSASGRQAKEYVDRGFSMVTVGTDTLLLRAAVQRNLQAAGRRDEVTAREGYA